jgi:hypothetical protein
MNKLFILLGGVLLLGTMSCNNQHEVVPAPVPVADLECSCKARVNGIDYEYVDTCTYDNEKLINTSAPSRASYKTIVQSASLNQGFEFEMKTLEWVDDGSNFPSIEEWKDYFQGNSSPAYYVNDEYSPNGIIVKWTDPTGVIWTSDTVSGCNGINFQYTSMEHDSDQTGNYMKFRAEFNCPVMNAAGDSMCIENGILKTSFKRE